MDYEKAYKAVLQTATQWIKDGCTDKEKICLECVFPELAESEDERIRKVIIEHFKQSETEFPGLTFGGYYYSDVLAYLEKQKEQKPNFDTHWENDSMVCEQKEQKPVEVKDPSMEELEAHSKALHDFKVFAAKQAEEHHISFVHDFEWNNFCGEILSYFNEQKYTPKFKVGDKLMSNGNHLLTYKILEVGHINELGNPEYKVEIFTDGKLDEPHNIHYMECRRVDEWGKLKEQKPEEWSEEEEQWLSEVYSAIDHSMYSEVERQAMKKYIDYLRYQSQQKASWNEEDEKNSAFIVAALDAYARLRKEKNNTSGQEDFDKAVSWIHDRLGFIRPQPKQEWSEEDKEALDMCLDAIPKAWKTKSGILLTKWLKDNIHLQPKQKWNEEDEKLLNYAISMTDDAQVKRFLKSLRLRCPKPSDNWKPSEEQMDRLFSIVAALRKDYCDDMADALAEIYHGLEKLI